MRRFERYVALGDSSTEGLDDPDGRGGFRGWANRLAEQVAAAHGPLLYANLGVRGRTTREIRDEQLAPALAMGPDLATLFSGTNDVIARRFDAAAFGVDARAMQSALIAAGATLLTFTLPDLTPVMPLARVLAARVARLNATLRAVSRDTGAVLVDLAAYRVAGDWRLWSEDRLHANAVGHARIAAALAEALGLPGTDDAWSRPLPGSVRRGPVPRIKAEMAWVGRHAVPWAWRHLRGRSSGDGRAAKRPRLEPVTII